MDLYITGQKHDFKASAFQTVERLVIRPKNDPSTNKFNMANQLRFRGSELAFISKQIRYRQDMEKPRTDFENALNMLLKQLLSTPSPRRVTEGLDEITMFEVI